MNAELKVPTSAPSLKAILATSLDAVVVINETGLVAGWNKNAERTFGYSSAEAMHRQVAELIGLSICRTIVEEHGGRFWASLNSSGTAFCFTLPVG